MTQAQPDLDPRVPADLVTPASLCLIELREYDGTSDNLRASTPAPAGSRMRLKNLVVGAFGNREAIYGKQTCAAHAERTAIQWRAF